MPEKTKREQYEQLAAALVSQRESNFDPHWKELSSYIFPRRTRFWTGDVNKGDKRNSAIINSTATMAARTLQSGMHAGLTSPARPWMKLTTPDPDLAEHGPVKEWLHTVTQRMLTIFLQSNLYRALPTVYGDMGCFATAAMAILEDSRDLFRAYTYPLGSFAIGIDERGMASTFVRQYQLTVRQLVYTFGGEHGMPLANKRDTPDWTRFSQTVKDAWDKGDYETGIDVTWIVKPNDYRNTERLEPELRMAFASCHWETSSQAAAKVFLRESGYQEFPFMVPRWSVGSSEDAYGSDSPGMLTLGDVKGLQIMERRQAQAINKMVDPPMTGPSSMKSAHTSILPGAITFVDVREGQQGFKAAHDVTLRIDHLGNSIYRSESRIQRGWFEDLFLMLANSDPSRGQQPITAREVEERHEEKLLALGPVLESTNDELLDLLVDRTFYMMERRGLLPAWPEELQGVQLKVEYLSVLAQAQKLVGVVGQDRFLQSVVPLMEQNPSMRHKVRWFRIVDTYGDMLGVDPRLIVPDAEANQAAEAEQQQQQQAAEAEQLKNIGAGVKSAATAPMDTDNALTRLTRNLGAA